MKSRHLLTLLKNKPSQRTITKKYSGLTSLKISIEVISTKANTKV